MSRRLPSRPRNYRNYESACFQSGMVQPFLNDNSETYYSSEDIHNTLLGFIEAVKYRKTDKVPMDMVNDVVKYAIWLTSGQRFYDLLIAQCDNGQLKDQTRDFLVDTVNMLACGHRIMNVHTWLRLFTTTEASYSASKRGPIKDHALYDALKATLPANPIATWLAMDGGFEDLLTTLYILFAQANFDPWQITPNRV